MEVIIQETLTDLKNACERCRKLNFQYNQKRNGFTKYL